MDKVQTLPGHFPSNITIDRVIRLMLFSVLDVVAEREEQLLIQQLTGFLSSYWFGNRSKDGKAALFPAFLKPSRVIPVVWITQAGAYTPTVMQYP
jgi:hypothetical protein